MPIRRDWASTLRDASFRGVPFEVDDDTIRNLLRQAVHEIPNGTWTVERLGRGATEISIKAYVASDLADVQAAAIGQAFQDDRPGLLIMPMVGPVQVSPIEAVRDRSASRHGYVGINLRFVVQPQAVAGVSSDFLANGIFAAAASLAIAVVSQVAALVRTADQPGHVVSAVTDGFSNAVSALEAVRVSSRSDASADVAVVTTSLSYRINETARDAASRAVVFGDFADAAVALGFGMMPDAAIDGFLPLRQLAAPPRLSAAASAVTASTNASAVASMARIVALAVEAEALARRDFVDQPATDAARIAFATRVADETDAIATTIQQSSVRRSAANSTIGALAELRRAVVDYLSTVSLDLAPRVTVETNARLPSRVWAWSLYADPSRAQELSRANRVRRPAFMPTRFRALAPTVKVPAEL